MPSDNNEPQVSYASDTVGLDQQNGPTMVRETGPVAGAAPAIQRDESTLRDSATPGPSAGMIIDNRQRALRNRYGGFYWGADFLGFAVAIFFTILFLGIVGAIVGAVGFQLHAQVPKIGSHISGQTQNLGMGALAGSIISVFLAYLLGGYAAGRMARFAGLLNGFGVWIWTIVVAILLSVSGAIFGRAFNVGSQIHLNVDRGTLTTAGAISLGVTLLVMLIGAVIGGRLGEHFHRAIDANREV